MWAWMETRGIHYHTVFSLKTSNDVIDSHALTNMCHRSALYSHQRALTKAFSVFFVHLVSNVHMPLSSVHCDGF